MHMILTVIFESKLGLSLEKVKLKRFSFVFLSFLHLRSHFRNFSLTFVKMSWFRITDKFAFVQVRLLLKFAFRI